MAGLVVPIAVAAGGCILRYVQSERRCGRSSDGNTPLHYAVTRGVGAIDEIDDLMNYNRCWIRSVFYPTAALDTRNNEGDTALVCAIRGGSVLAAERLIEIGARIDIRCPCSPKNTPFALACERGELHLLEVMINKDPRIVQKNGYCLLSACKNGRSDVALFLINQGAWVSYTKDQGVTSLHYAARRGDCGTAKCLLDHGADVNRTTCYGNATPLHWALREEDVSEEIVVLLLRNGARIDIQDRNGDTAKSLALTKPQGIQDLLQ